MVDWVHARDEQLVEDSRKKTTPRPGPAASPSPDPAPRGGPPRTDIGTILLHWAVAIAMVTSLLTGIRIAADNLDAPFSRWLSPILPQGEIWTWHYMAGLALFFCATAYLLYMRRSGLHRRVAPKKLRVFLLPTADKLKYAALNVALHWFIYGVVLLMTGTGVVLYLGHGGWWVWVHSTAAFVALGYILVHVVSHYLYGGLAQLLRLFRPARLVVTRATRARPLLVGVSLGVATVAAIAGLDWATRDTLVIRRVAAAPKLELLLDDPVWSSVRPAWVQTQQGANLGGTGASLVEIRAVHDGKKVYFAFRWEDPSRSFPRLPLVKQADGWHMMHDYAGSADVNTFYEDKFAVIFSQSAGFGSGGTSHFGPRPVADRPSSLNERGLHYTSDGSYVDMWQWKATRGGLIGHVDDQYMGPLRDATPDEANKKARYQGGYWNDPGRAFYSYNFKFEGPGGYRGPIQPLRLPKDWKAMMAKLGKFDFSNPDFSYDEGTQWWLLDNETVPYSAEVDQTIPVGTVLPGVVIKGDYEGDRADVRGSARWRDGHWTLVTSRDLVTGSKYDQDFVPGRDLYMWVAVFDHTQTRHTRHTRPVRIVTTE